MIANAPTRRPWRWRRCPVCRTVERAGLFVAVQYGRSWRFGDIPRRCPNCDYEAPTWRFPVLRERHPS
jgi:hypothetical protein